MDSNAAFELDYGIAASIRALVNAMAMQAENKQREALGQSMAYSSDAFLEVIDREGISHNAIMKRWDGKL